MELKTEKKGNTLHITVYGIVDNAAAEEMKRQLLAVCEDDFDEVVFNLTFVPFMSSSGIGKLIVCYREALERGKTMRVKGVSESLFQAFEIARLTNLLKIEK